MTTIIDPELTVRLGALPPAEVERIQDYATAAFLWRGMRQAEALEVARGLHWRAVGRDPTAAAEEVVTALALHPLTAGEGRRLAARLDAECPAGSPANGPGTPRPAELRDLGRRLARALALLDPVERAVAH